MQIVHFTPPQLANLLQVNETTIKRWIWSSMLKTEKTPGGHYRVSQNSLNDFIKKYPEFSKNSYTVKRNLKNKDQFKNAWLSYYNLLLSNKHQEAFDLLRQLYVSGESLVEIMDKTIAMALWKVGDEYNNGKITIYEEHKISFRVSEHLSDFDQFFKTTKKRKEKVLVLCAPEENHIIPLQMLDVLLRSFGFDAHVLGINISFDQLKKAVKDLSPKMVCITKVYSEKNLNYFKMISALAKKEKLFLALGGSGWGALAKKTKNENVTWFASLLDFELFLKSF